MATPSEKNIRANQTTDVVWDNNDLLSSLDAVRRNAEEEGQKAIGWYWNKKPAKSFPSQAIQFSALALTAAAGIIPMIIQSVKSFRPGAFPDGFDSGPIASLCVAVAASLIGLDKAFGYSSGWTRYVLTATSMTKVLHEFRLDWVAMAASCAVPPTPEERAKLVQRARDFISSIQSMVLQETKEWATEFQSNMAQIEKDLKSQLEALKAQVDKAAKEKDDAARTGSIELTVANADKTDGFQFTVILENASGKSSESVSNAKVWSRINTPPGQYKLSVEAKANGSAIVTSMVLEVKPGEIAKPALAVPIP